MRRYYSSVIKFSNGAYCWPRAAIMQLSLKGLMEFDHVHQLWNIIIIFTGVCCWQCAAIAQISIMFNGACRWPCADIIQMSSRFPLVLTVDHMRNYYANFIKCLLGFDHVHQLWNMEIIFTGVWRWQCAAIAQMWIMFNGACRQPCAAFIQVPLRFLPLLPVDHVQPLCNCH